ncbi:hypothetical protein LCGC14_1684100 [marine sediment metagenome]|uniref:Uncharacterized protein n=1 Tax=marine sediment metagenome TaxID=412755 RepID=A0A0F9KMT4_9ZZZZ
MNWPTIKRTKKRKPPRTILLILTYFGGLLDGTEQVIQVSEDELDQVDGTIKTEIDSEICRYFYESLVNYTPAIGCYPMNHIKTERLPEK